MLHTKLSSKTFVIFQQQDKNVYKTSNATAFLNFFSDCFYTNSVDALEVDHLPILLKDNNESDDK